MECGDIAVLKVGGGGSWLRVELNPGLGIPDKFSPKRDKRDTRQRRASDETQALRSLSSLHSPHHRDNSLLIE